MTAGTLVPAAEGVPVEEAETEKAALPAGAGASLEEAKTDTEATEAMDGDRSQLEEAEAAATQVHVLVNGVLGRWWPLEPLLADGDTSFGGGVMDGM